MHQSYIILQEININIKDLFHKTIDIIFHPYYPLKYQPHIIFTYSLILGRIKWLSFTHYISVLSIYFFCIVRYMAVIYSKENFIDTFIYLKIMKHKLIFSEKQILNIYIPC